MATALIYVAVSISILLTSHTIFNRFKLISARPKSITEHVAILIPARNEELNIASAVRSALDQKFLNSFEIVVLDDDSSDTTPKILGGISDPKFRVLSGTEKLPSHWLGKNWACHRLAQGVTAEYLVFIDSDVILDPLAVASAITAMRENDLDLVSPYPKQLSSTFLAKLVQPLLQWSWLTTVPLGVARRTNRQSLAVANGQFLVCTSAAYKASGGHEATKDRVLDDIELLRSFYRAGYHGCVIDGSKIATCHMYRSNVELISGYSKSLWAAFGGFIGSIAVNLLFLFIYVFPLYGLASNQADLAIIGFLSGTLGRIVSARSSAGRIFPDSLLHPLSILIFSWLNGVSWFRHLRGTNTWKLRELR